MYTPLWLKPITFAQAREFVATHHRHHKPPAGHKFSIGVESDSGLVGVAIVGRPVSRVLDATGDTLEVTRTATDGTPNANSMLLAAARRATFALGYTRVITYTQDGESGASLRAAGFIVAKKLPPTPGWDRPSRERVPTGNEWVGRVRWECGSNTRRAR